MSENKIEIKSVLVKDIKPYEHNDRIITEEAILAVETSIKTYGYNVPLLIDTDNVIIAGHVRHEALLRLKIKEITCMVVNEPDEVKKDKMRLLDNAISEAASWHDAKLGQELRMIQDLGDDNNWAVFSSMFGQGSGLDNLLKNSLGQKIKDLTAGNIDSAQKKEHAKFTKIRSNDKDRDVTCPKCGNKFQVRVYES